MIKKPRIPKEEQGLQKLSPAERERRRNKRKAKRLLELFTEAFAPKPEEQDDA